MWKQRHLLWELLIRNIEARYKGSVFGIAWSIAQPLMMLAVYTFVFSTVFKARWEILGLENNDAAFPLILFCGLALFQMFSEAISASSTVVLANSSLVKKVIFPLELLPLSSVLTGFFFGFVWFAPLFVCACYFLDSLSWTMLLLPITIIALFFLTAGISFVVAAFGVYLRDIPQLVAVGVQVLFFMTPIFYPLKLVPEKYHWLLNANPLTFIVEETRKLFLYKQQPDYQACLLIILSCWLVFQLGFCCFAKMKKGFADVC